MKTISGIVAILATAVGGAAFAQATGTAHGGMQMEGMHGQPSGMGALMGDGMASSGDPDIDFARAMILHHEGAVAMSQILLETGDDPELLDLARTVIDSQREEIDFMQEWLARNGE